MTYYQFGLLLLLFTTIAFSFAVRGKSNELRNLNLFVLCMFYIIGMALCIGSTFIFFWRNMP